MPWKLPKLALSTVFLLISIACISRVLSINNDGDSPDLSPTLDSPTNDGYFNSDDNDDADVDIHLEDEVISPIVPRVSHAQQTRKTLIPPIVVSDSDGGFSSPHSSPTTAPSKSHPPCFPDEVLLVSTMDGKITALDLDRLERPIWSVGTGSSAASTPEPLLSTSNTKIEAGASWVIPSLDGMFHQFFTGEKGESLRSTVCIIANQVIARPNHPHSSSFISM